MLKYIASDVIVRLHYQKVGQNNSQKKAIAFVVAIFCLVVILLAVFNSGDGCQRESLLLSGSEVRVHPFDYLKVKYSRPSPSSNATKFPIGFVGKVRVVREKRDLVLPLQGLPEPYRPNVSALGVAYELETNDSVLSVSTDINFGLPDTPRLWTYRLRSLPTSVVGGEAPVLPIIRRKAHAMLQNPDIPDGVYLVDDTAIVEGWLTLHSQGNMSFELVSEIPAGQGFGDAVRTAVERGQCIPATDLMDKSLTVRIRYRCLFFHGAESSVSVGNVVSARVRKVNDANSRKTQ